MKTIAEQLNIREFPFEIFDKKGNKIYYENSLGLWEKREYDSKGNEIYFEDSDGGVIDNRTIPEYTMEQLVEKLGNFKIKK